MYYGMKVVNVCVGFFVCFLIGFIYYCLRSNFNRKKLIDFIYPKVKTSIY